MAEKNPQDVIDGVVEALREADLLPDDPPAQTVHPDPSVHQVEQIVEMLRSVEENNGHVGIAMSVGVPTAFVRLVASAMERRLAELNVEEAEAGEMEPLSL